METVLPAEPKPSPRPSSRGSGGLFPRTQWSAISLARGVDDDEAARGMAELAGNYWRPLYLYLRKKGESHDDACDAVQSFFEFVLGGEFLSYIDREGGKFRSFLLKSLDRWRSRLRVRDGAQKRGGGIEHVPLDGVDELQAEIDVGDGRSAEESFDRRWALELMRRASSGLRENYEKRGREDWFDVLKPTLPGGDGLDGYVGAAALLGASEGAVKKAVFDLRAAFAVRLKEEIRSTVRTNEDAEEELKYLISVFTGG